MTPPRMIDVHAHIIDPTRFPYSAQATYRPSGTEIGPVERYLEVLDAHGVSHAVVVQPTSGYLFDNAVTVDAVSRARGRLRGILRIDPERARSDESLLDHPAVAGARLDLVGDGIEALKHPGNRRLLAAIKERGQVLVVQAEKDQLADAIELLAGSGVSLCVDHCGRPDPARGLGQPGFAALLELGRLGHAVKLSGPFRFSLEAPPFTDALPFVAALLEAFTPSQCCWGSDWPYLRAERRIEYADELELLARWVPDVAARDKILRVTPSRVFKFDLQ